MNPYELVHWGLAVGLAILAASVPAAIGLGIIKATLSYKSRPQGGA